MTWIQRGNENRSEVSYWLVEQWNNRTYPIVVVEMNDDTWPLIFIFLLYGSQKTNVWGLIAADSFPLGCVYKGLLSLFIITFTVRLQECDDRCCSIPTPLSSHQFTHTCRSAHGTAITASSSSSTTFAFSPALALDVRKWWSSSSRYVRDPARSLMEVWGSTCCCGVKWQILAGRVTKTLEDKIHLGWR